MVKFYNLIFRLYHKPNHADLRSLTHFIACYLGTSSLSFFNIKEKGLSEHNYVISEKITSEFKEGGVDSCNGLRASYSCLPFLIIYQDCVVLSSLNNDLMFRPNLVNISSDHHLISYKSRLRRRLDGSISGMLSLYPGDTARYYAFGVENADNSSLKTTCIQDLCKVMIIGKKGYSN